MDTKDSVFSIVFCWSLSLTAVGQAWTQQAAWARLSIILNLPPAIAHQLWLLSDVCASPEWPNPTISPVIIELMDGQLLAFMDDIWAQDKLANQWNS